jgi:outer membrane protein TolC
MTGSNPRSRALRCAASATILLLALPPGPRVLEAQQRVVTLDEARRLASQIEPGVVTAQGAVRNAEAQVRSAKGAYLPSLNASSNGASVFTEGPPRINSSTGEIVGGNTTQKNVGMGLNASLDLFTGFRRGADSRTAKATRAASEAGLADARYGAILNVTTQYFLTLAAQQLVRVREASVQRANEQLQISVAKLQAGSATRSDSLRSVVTLGTTTLDLVNAQADVAATQAELARQIGENGRVAAADDSSFYVVNTNVDTAALHEEVVASSPKVQSADAAAAAARASLKSSQAAYWPTVALSGSTNWAGTSNRDYQLFNQRQLAIGVNWNLFNRFVREQTIDNRISAVDAAEATAADTRRQVGSSLTAELAQLDAAVLKIQITQTSVAAAQEDLRVVGERYRLGAATILDVLTSQEALTQAQVDAVTARFDYVRAKAQIEALIGRDL